MVALGREKGFAFSEDHLAGAVTFRSWFSLPTEIQGGTGREYAPKPTSSAPDLQQLLPIGHACTKNKRAILG